MCKIISDRQQLIARLTLAMVAFVISALPGFSWGKQAPTDDVNLETLKELQELGVFTLLSNGDVTRDTMQRTFAEVAPERLPADRLEKILAFVDKVPENPFCEMAPLQLVFSWWTGSEADWEILKRITIPFAVVGGGHINERTLKILAETKCQGLYYLDYANPGEIAGVSKNDIELIAKCGNLQCLSFAYCRIQPGDLETLSDSAIRHLEFGEPVDQLLLDAVGELENLEVLVFGQVRCTESESGFLALKNLKFLAALSIQTNTIQPLHLRNLDKLPALRALKLMGRDRHVNAIAHLEHLKALDVTAGKLTDQSIKSISGLADLESLRLNGNFTDHAFDQLDNLKNLRILVLGDCLCTSERVEQFRNDHSGLKGSVSTHFSDPDFPEDDAIALASSGIYIGRMPIPGEKNPITIDLYADSWEGNAEDLKRLHNMTPVWLGLYLKLSREEADVIFELPTDSVVHIYRDQDPEIERRLNSRFSR